MRLNTSFASRVGVLVAGGAVVAVTAAITPLAAAEPSSRPAVASDGTSKVEKAPDGKYIVRLADLPAAGYDGDVAGLQATKPGRGDKYDSASAASRAYAGYLDERRADVLSAAGVQADQVLYEYGTVFAGFAADLTHDQATALAATPGVASVEPNWIAEPDTSNSPTFLGLDQPGSGLWDQLGGPTGVGGAGEDLVVGVVDSGFSPSAGSYDPLDPAPENAVPDGWAGTCDPGDPDDFGGGPPLDEDQPDPAAIDCDGDVFNSKVIGARYFDAGSAPHAPGEFVSPKDYGGHGSHTSSTAAGNNGVPVEVGGNPLGEISGMAPRARLSIYKVCWELQGCAGIDSVAAIDTAVADGVDVLNFSISGTTGSAVDAVAISFLFAADANVFVAVSAGNSGPSSATTNHNYPWVNTTAASTQDRSFRVVVSGEGGEEWTGEGSGTAVPESPSIYAANAAANGVPAADAALCFPDSLDPDKVDGNIVVCDRGSNARVEKSAVVEDAGGVGMVLANDAASGGSVSAERHSVPTAHVAFAVGNEIKDYVGLESDNNVSLSLSDSEVFIGDAVTAPEMAAFSSRGPGGVAGGDLLKPDITAPGVDILASLAPTNINYGEQYGFISGTSMSSPHIAGIGALLRDLHPDWSPAAIKSAIVTTGYQQNNQGEPIQALDPETGELVDATPLNYGGGHVDPQAAAAVPAVYEAGFEDYVQFLCGAGQFDPDGSTCASFGSIDPSDLNYPSIAIGDLAGTQTVIRTLTNVTDGTLELSADIAVDGITAVVTPSELSIEAGGSAEFTVEFTRTDAADLDTYAFGALTWTAGGDARTVRSPIAIQPVGVGDVERLLVGEGSTGEVTDTIISGVDGQIDIELGGLAAAQVDSAVLTDPTSGSFPIDDPKSCFDDPACAPHVAEFTYDVPKGAKLLYVALYEEDYVPGTDLDMYVYIEDGKELAVVGASATGEVAETVSVGEPEAGTYHVFIDLWALAEDETELEAINHTWAVTNDDVDEFSVEPEPVDGTIGGAQDVTFSWTDLALPDPAGDADQPSESTARYLGTADYQDGASGDQFVRGLVRVDVVAGGEPTTPPTTEPPTTEPPTTEPPTTEPPTTSPPGTTPVPTTTLPGTGGGSAGLYAGLGLAALLGGGLIVAMAARRLRTES